jgi:MFS family permease
VLGTPSPLYGVYRELWGFSPVVLTLVYATYAFGVLTTLVLAGRVSDDVGRRPVLLVALGTLLGTTVLFMVADSVVWLFVARGLQGLATGMGLGVLMSATFVELLPAPRVLPYVALAVLFAIALAGVALMPEPVEERTRLRLTPQRPSVPAVVRRPFLLAALGVISSWSIGGLFLALGPQLSASLFHTDNHLVSGVSVFALAGSGAIGQLVFGRAVPWAGASAGSVALAAGLLLIVAAASTDSSALLVTGSIIGGGGFGVAFLGALRALSGAIPPEHRAAVMSAFYIVGYLSISLPAVLAGVLVTPLGLEATFEIFASVLAGVALILAFEAWRTRPRRQPVAAELGYDVAR